MRILFIAVVLFSGSLTAAQDDHIRNFQVASKNSTHITFSWDIVDGYYSSSDIHYFYLYYQHRTSTYSQYISYSSATRSGTTFSYTHSLESFNNGPYIMWMHVYRMYFVYPSSVNSERKYVDIGQVETNDTILELKVHLHPAITCSEFLLGTHVDISDASREVEWTIHETCQCTLPYDFSVRDGYFTCTASDYVIFRAKLSMSYSSSTVDMASLKANLSNFFTRQDERTPITMNGGRYFIEPGPCGLTVPQLDSPHCLDSSPTQQASAAVSTSPQDSNVTTIVAIMSVSLAVVVLGGCIVYLVIGLRIVNHRRTKTPEVKAPRLRDLEMTSEVRSRNIPPSRAEDHVYASSDIPIQRNPHYTYGMTK